MVQYISKPLLKAAPHFGRINLKNLTAYGPNLILWGGASTFGLLVFTEGIPLIQKAFYEKIPVFGSHWIKNPDPQDLPQ